jgi:ABC-type iron transport system FetAB ATPase subunit
MKYLLLITLLTLSLSALADEFYKGENLITPHEMDADKWEVLQKVEGSFRSMMWRSIEKGMADTYIVNIQGGNKSALAEVREIQDAPGLKSCESFDSIDLDPILSTNFESMMWRTVCSNGPDFKAQILQLAIKGNDSIYHIQKIWRGELAEDEIDKWVTTFENIYVCDTREENKQCLSSFEKVKDL